MKKYFLVILILVLAIPFSLAQDMPSLGDLPMGEWSQINPEGETSCARGGEYKFFVRPADSDKLLVHFQGGGACWDDLSCSIGNGNSEGGGVLGEDVTLFKDTVADGEGMAYTNGIFDLENASNPVADYNVILVNYCTADIHYGAGDTTYTDVVTEEEITVAHNGVPNADAVLNWTFENFDAPSDVFITGCSAGAYGSIRHAPTILDAYPDANSAQLGDSGVGGLLAPDFSGFTNWRFWETVPDFVSAIPEDEFSTDKQYIASAQAYPDAHFAQYNTFLDGTQIFFAGLLNGVDLSDDVAVEQLARDWATDMVTQVNTINATVDNFDYFTMSGNVHCVLNDGLFYEYSAGETPLTDWVADLVDGDGAEDISCDIEAGECVMASVDG